MSAKQISASALKSAAIATVMSTITAGVSYCVDFAQNNPVGYNNWAGSLPKGEGITPITAGFGEMMKGFFSAVDDALVYLFAE